MANYRNFPFPLPEDESKGLKEEGKINVKENARVIYERPAIITVICGYFFISWSLTLISLLRLLFQTKDISLNLSTFGSLSGLVSFLTSILIFVSIFGFWFVRKWGVYLYTAVNIFIFIYLLLKLNSYGISFGDIFSAIFWGSILPIFVIIVGFMNLNRMK
ncbi:hypothetical protein KJ841_02115 [Patescibacteria group bacterium]|nr:hypothetical protein [Patescibacteria group bacterium]